MYVHVATPMRHIVRMANKRIDPRLRAQFKETARIIISRDRTARKFGSTQNTVGDIERALVQAFQLGQEIGDSSFAPPRPDHLGISWEEVNPRGREVLRGLSYGSSDYGIEDAIGMQSMELDGRTRWVKIYPDGRVSDHTVASGSVDPLVRLGLLTSHGDGLLVLTPKGRATCEAYWRRRAASDLTLPKESLRA